MTPRSLKRRWPSAGSARAHSFTNDGKGLLSHWLVRGDVIGVSKKRWSISERGTFQSRGESTA
jgi:hypothetical protein